MEKVNLPQERTEPGRKIEKTELTQRLAEIVGNEYVCGDPDTLFIYSQDMTENEPSEPELVVMPDSVEEIQAIVRLANEEKIPLTPFVAGANVGGLTIPREGGIVVDLKRMQRLLEVNEDDMYVNIEPGVTFGHLRACLDKEHPRFRYAYPLSPPYTSVMCNALLDGLTNLSTKHGDMSEWINSLEVVLPTGELVNIGAAAVSKFWFGRAPLPDLAGLFIGWQGTTGIVTKMAVQICPKYKYQKRMFVMAYDIDSFFAFVRRCAWTQLYDDIAGFSWPAVKMMLARRVGITKSPDEPELGAYLDFSGDSKKEMEFKEEMVSDIIKGLKDKGIELEPPLLVDDLVKINPDYLKLAEFPTTLDFLIDYGGGGFTWVGSYGPMSKSEEGTKKVFAVMEKYGFPPLLVTRPMRGGHYQVLRFIAPFDKSDPEQVKKVRELCREMAETLLDLGFIPYKAPPWAAELIMKRADPNWVKLLRTIKNTLDPNRIMNPGNWGL